MGWHRIPEELVTEALREPEIEEPAAGGRVNRWRQLGGRYLRVTLRDEPDRIVVISAVFKRRPPRGSGQS